MAYRRTDGLLATLAVAAVAIAACSARPSPSGAPSDAPVAAPSVNSGPSKSPSLNPSAAPLKTPEPTAGPSDRAVAITGRTTCEGTASGTTTAFSGGERQRGAELTCADVTSDPRVTGTDVAGWSYDWWDGRGAVQWGPARIENGGGSWEGAWFGVIFPDSSEEMHVWLAGRGGYEGLAYLQHVVPASDAYELDGLVYPGDPPPGVLLKVPTTPSPDGTPVPANHPDLSAVTVSGSASCRYPVEGTMTTFDGGERIREAGLECTETMSDPRLSAEAVVGWNYDWWEGYGGVQWGSQRWTNDGGAWEGIWLGVVYTGPRDEVMSWLVGRGAYEGLTFVGHTTGGGSSFETHGLLYPGSPPPVISMPGGG